MEHAWRDASIATGLISSVPTLVLPFIPQSATRNGSGLQRILLCFAVGGMMGDVFLHLLPHLLMGEWSDTVAVLYYTLRTWKEKGKGCGPRGRGGAASRTRLPQLRVGTIYPK